MLQERVKTSAKCKTGNKSIRKGFEVTFTEKSENYYCSLEQNNILETSTLSLGDYDLMSDSRSRKNIWALVKTLCWKERCTEAVCRTLNVSVTKNYQYWCC